MKQNKHILLAEDNSGIQDTIKIYFERAGYDISIHPDGNVILKGNYKLPDLYILDKQLSGVDGIDICRHLKNREQTRDIPVIMISASIFVRTMALTAGADDFLEKPFKMSDLLQVVQRHLDTR